LPGAGEAAAVSDLSVRLILDSSVEEVLGWKCVSLQDMNLEIHVKNNGPAPVGLKSEIELSGEDWSEKIDYLYPHGLHRIEPGEAMALYCSYDPEKTGRVSHVTITDEGGKRHRAAVTGRMEECEDIESQ